MDDQHQISKQRPGISAQRMLPLLPQIAGTGPIAQSLSRKILGETKGRGFMDGSHSYEDRNKATIRQSGH
jgi:hypothetical protein